MLLMRGATATVVNPDVGVLYFNPRSSCEERRQCGHGCWCQADISIHAPHARSDSFHRVDYRRQSYFNPRSSCEERPATLDVTPIVKRISIHAPHARSDKGIQSFVNYPEDFNPRSSCEERRLKCDISKFYPSVFQSTLLMRGATLTNQALEGMSEISIHAPHARSDLTTVLLAVQYNQFQSTLLMRGAT